jgi:hypothetical protein
MVGAGCLEKLLEVIGRLPHQALEVVLNNGDVFLIRVAGHLVVVALIAAGSDHNSLDSLL